MLQEIYSDKIDDPRAPMRGDLDRGALFELADDIKANGLINPIMVRPVGERFEVAAGHRRLAACKIAGIIKIPCVVRELTDEQVFAVMTAENLSREDVPLLDECRHYKNAMERFKKSVGEIAAAARRSESYIRARLAIADMPEYLQNYLQEGKIKLGSALALLEVADEATRRLWVEMAVRDGVSNSQVEFWVQGWRLQQLPAGTAPAGPPAGYAAAAPEGVMFECAIDGKKYDARVCKPLIIFEGNLPVFNIFVSEYRRQSAADENPPPEAAG